MRTNSLSKAKELEKELRKLSLHIWRAPHPTIPKGLDQLVPPLYPGWTAISRVGSGSDWCTCCSLNDLRVTSRTPSVRQIDPLDRDVTTSKEIVEVLNPVGTRADDKSIGGLDLLYGRGTAHSGYPRRKIVEGAT